MIPPQDAASTNPVTSAGIFAAIANVGGGGTGGVDVRLVADQTAREALLPADLETGELIIQLDTSEIYYFNGSFCHSC